ncbi:gamma-aminobutyric acid receptor subunit alpha-2 [Caerostris darwini]|uniref:Gamma-aminobutyric acid receptor subunit alpha-2 n=1 Tax=Caerostris darwini TaxID=1538125 RepID=A0AAV4UGD0_9ARAC|nr:gamma-aminobutyric acid receptor subunit alpha-2 [Caerostris darwini]
MVLVVFSFLLCYSDTSMSLSPADRTCNSLIPDGYEIHKPSGKSTKVFTWVQIMDFGDINQANMDFLLHAFVINVWNDTRLHLDPYRGQERATILYPGCRQYVWTPQIFFETAKEAKSDETHLPSSQFKILPDGAVYLSTKPFSLNRSAGANCTDFDGEVAAVNRELTEVAKRE